MLDGLRASSTRQDSPPTIQNVNVASVVASFDSATMIGATASIKRGEESPARPQHPPAHAPDEQASPGSRQGRDEASAEWRVADQRRAQPHQPVDEDRLVIPRLAVEGRDDPVPPGPHLADRRGIARLVPVPESGAPIPRQVNAQRHQDNQERGGPSPPGEVRPDSPTGFRRVERISIRGSVPHGHPPRRSFDPAAAGRQHPWLPAPRRPSMTGPAILARALRYPSVLFRDPSRCSPRTIGLQTSNRRVGQRRSRHATHRTVVGCADFVG